MIYADFWKNICIRENEEQLSEVDEQIYIIRHKENKEFLKQKLQALKQQQEVILCLLVWTYESH